VGRISWPVSLDEVCRTRRPLLVKTCGAHGGPPPRDVFGGRYQFTSQGPGSCSVLLQKLIGEVPLGPNGQGLVAVLRSLVRGYRDSVGHRRRDLRKGGIAEFFRKHSCA